MSIYFSEPEAKDWEACKNVEPAATLGWSMLQRAAKRSAHPGLMDSEATVDWWHLVVEYLAEAAVAYRLKPDAALGRWIVAVVNDIVQRDEEQWGGPWFRDHQRTPRRGHLETGHVCLAVAAAIDLAAEAFTQAQLESARCALRQRGVALCTRWLEDGSWNNWRCILTAGLAAAAVANRDAHGIGRAVRQFQLCAAMFQPDGSHGESSQYASYAAWGLAMTYETLVRHDAALAQRLSIEPYARCVRWWATNLMYLQPLTG